MEAEILSREYWRDMALGYRELYYRVAKDHKERAELLAESYKRLEDAQERIIELEKVCNMYGAGIINYLVGCENLEDEHSEVKDG